MTSTDSPTLADNTRTGACPDCAAALTITLRPTDAGTLCFCLRCGRTFQAQAKALEQDQEAA